MMDFFRCSREADSASLAAVNIKAAQSKLKCASCAYSLNCTGPVKVAGVARGNLNDIKAALNALKGKMCAKNQIYKELFAELSTEINAAKKRGASWTTIAKTLSNHGFPVTAEGLPKQWRAFLREKSAGRCSGGTADKN